MVQELRIVSSVPAVSFDLEYCSLQTSSCAWGDRGVTCACSLELKPGCAARADLHCCSPLEGSCGSADSWVGGIWDKPC